MAQGAPAWFNEFFGREAWRFVFVQNVVSDLAKTAIEFPPMQAPAVQSGQRQAKNPGGDQGTRRAIIAFGKRDGLSQRPPVSPKVPASPLWVISGHRPALGFLRFSTPSIFLR